MSLALDPEIAKRSPDETAAHFAPAGQLERQSIMSDRLQLNTKTESYAVRIAYVQDTGWIFQAAFVELIPQDTATLESLYNTIDALLVTKLGTAKNVDKSGDALPRKMYPMRGKLLAFISERSSGGRPVVFVEVAAPEEGGG